MNAHEQLSNPQLEKRAQALDAQILCPTCAGQTLAESASETAADLRHLVRQQILEGASDEEILQSFQSTFGERILLKPPTEIATLPLWGLPVALLIGLAVVLFKMWRRRASF